MKKIHILGVISFLCVLCFLGAIAISYYLTNSLEVSKVNKEEGSSVIQKATIVASGDMLYHDIVYGSAFNEGSYDFSNDYEQIKPLIASADLALGDFEGTITPGQPLSGYPLFNAPIEVVDSIKDTGYDVIDLAHNHILDFGLEGALSTYQIFNDNGFDTLGIVKDRDEILIKNVNGIKIAILGYSYGYNGMEATISSEDYQKHLKYLDLNKIHDDIIEAEQLADITVIMPQLGEEYQLSPTAEQRQYYEQMIEWGADIVFGGHPHVVEPMTLIEHDGQQKFIIYSMGNLLSNQRIETLDNPFTECGVIVELSMIKQDGVTSIQQITPHPTWVMRTEIPRKFGEYQAYDYQVVLSENYLEDGQLRETVDNTTRQRIVDSYERVMAILDDEIIH